MKTRTAFAILAAAVPCGFSRLAAGAADIDSLPPVVVKTVPEAGTAKVPPGEYEVKVTFSKEMQDRSWSWSTAWNDSTPEVISEPRYEADHKTCVLKVKLEANKTYGWWLNSQKFHNFRDVQGHAAVPYLLAFETGPTAASSKTGIAPAATKATSSLASSASGAPAVFQLRLVVDTPSEQSEPMVLVETSKEPARTETFHVQKTALLDQTALKSARAHVDESTGGFRIDIAFTNLGQKRFAEITRDNLGKRLAIVIGGKLYAAPKIMSEIPDGQAQIAGTFSEQEAKDLAAKISEAIAAAAE